MEFLDLDLLIHDYSTRWFHLVDPAYALSDKKNVIIVSGSNFIFAFNMGFEKLCELFGPTEEKVIHMYGY